MAMAKHEDLFVKDALNLKQLRKKDKGERDSTIEVYLQPLVDVYYSGSYMKDQETRDKMIDLIMTPMFIKSVGRIYKDNPEEVPKSFVLMAIDLLEQGERLIASHINDEYKSDRPKDEIEQTVKELNEMSLEAHTAVFNLVEKLTKKSVDKLKKIGMKKDWATIFAPSLLPDDAITTNNMFRFVPRYTREIYRLVNSAYRDENGTLVNTLGIDLTSSKTMDKFMELVTKNMSIDTFGEFLKQLLLEKRTPKFDEMTKQQLNVYSSITNYVLRVLESKKYFEPKERCEIIRGYFERRDRDAKHNRDACRRIEFKHLVPEDYPRIIKALEQVISKRKNKMKRD